MQATHPDEQTLKAYGLGKLDDGPATTVNDHLETCEECRQKLSGLTSDSFLGKFRDARQPTARSMFGGSMIDGTVSFLQAKATAAPPSVDTIPPGLSNHPDYEIKRELGRGGMGVVYLAHNTMMGRDEVLKVMGRQIMERPGVLERFQREIRAVAKLRHPNIVMAHSAFRIDGGLVFSMEYVEGLDLARLVKAKGPLSVSHAAYFIHQAALGLQHAHEKGLIHRDIKPHNLMLTHDGKARLVKVLDFGLAKATREEKIDGGLTSEGQALGTPDYIAPEQITNAIDVDIRADIYSLGGTLFYLLTGRPPFQATSLYDIYQAHMSRDIEPLNLIRPEVPAELAALVGKMMAKEPRRRFQTPAEVAHALTPYFKKLSPSPRSTRGEISQPVPPIATKPAAVKKPQVSRLKASEPVEGKFLWESLIKERAPEKLIIQPRVSATRQRPPWASKTIVIAASLFLLGTLGIITIILKRDNGRETKITIETTLPGKAMPQPTRTEISSPEAKLVKSETPKSQFISLFNGKNLEGWTHALANGSRWSVDTSGVLEGVGNGQGNPAVLLTQRQDFGNFRLRAKFRHTRAGSHMGLFELRRTTTGTDTSGYFVMHGEAEDMGGMGSISSAQKYTYGNPFDWKWRADLVHLELDRWYLMEISLIGNRLTTSIDGKKAVEVVDVDEKHRKGAIALSLAGGTTAQFEKILIEELPDDFVEPKKPSVTAGTTTVHPTVSERIPATTAVAMSDLDRVATGKWVRIVDDNTPLTDPAKMKMKKGILELNACSLRIPGIDARNLILRAKVLTYSGMYWGNVNLAVRYKDSEGYSAWFNGSRFGGDNYGIGRLGSPYRDLSASNSGRKFEPDKYVEMALAAIGDTLTLYVDGTRLITVKNDELDRGSVRVGSHRGLSFFKDVECQILDTVPVAPGQGSKNP